MTSKQKGETMGEIKVGMDTKTLTIIIDELVAAKEADKDFHPPPIPLSPSQKWTKKWASQIKETWWQAEVIFAECSPGDGGDCDTYSGKVKLIGTDIEVCFFAEYSTGIGFVWWASVHTDYLESLLGQPTGKDIGGHRYFPAGEIAIWKGKKMDVQIFWHDFGKKLHVCGCAELGSNTIVDNVRKEEK